MKAAADLTGSGSKHFMPDRGALKSLPKSDVLRPCGSSTGRQGRLKPAFSVL